MAPAFNKTSCSIGQRAPKLCSERGRQNERHLREGTMQPLFSGVQPLHCICVLLLCVEELSSVKVYKHLCGGRPATYIIYSKGVC